MYYAIMHYMSAPLTVDRVIGNRVRELRNQVGWPQDELARRMRHYGFDTWAQSTVAKIEKADGKPRRVLADELVGLAFVLGVSPAALLTPTAWEAQVKVTPNTTTSGNGIWQWITGATRMGGALIDDVFKLPDDFSKLEELERRYEEAAPDFLKTAERRLPGLRRLVRSAARTASAASMPDEHAVHSFEGAAQYLDDLIEDATALSKLAKREAARARQAPAPALAPTTKRKGTK
jgi:transcriptional regulator with XRE-family HTH domain